MVTYVPDVNLHLVEHSGVGSITRFLNDAGVSNTNCTEEMLTVVYRELRQLAKQRLRYEAPGQTLQATALVHEAYVRLLRSKNGSSQWQNRAHFFAAASEAMRRIVIVIHLRKNCQKRGGGRMERVHIDLDGVSQHCPNVDLQALNEALRALEDFDAHKGLLVKLRFFAGMSMAEAADVLGVSLPTAERHWRYSRAFLATHLLKS